MKTETLQKVMKAINSYNRGELGPEQAFAMLLVPVMVEVMEEGRPTQQKPLEVSEEARADILLRKEQGNITDMQVLALVLLDQLQAQEREACVRWEGEVPA